MQRLEVVTFAAENQGALHYGSLGWDRLKQFDLLQEMTKIFLDGLSIAKVKLKDAKMPISFSVVSRPQMVRFVLIKDQNSGPDLLAQPLLKLSWAVKVTLNCERYQQNRSFQSSFVSLAYKYLHSRLTAVNVRCRLNLCQHDVHDIGKIVRKLKMLHG